MEHVSPPTLIIPGDKRALAAYTEKFRFGYTEKQIHAEP